MSEKPSGHFEARSFCQVSSLKVLMKSIDFQAPWRQFLGSLPRLRAAPLFAFLLAAQFIPEFTVLQLKGECFAPPSAMNYENALS